MSAPRVVSLGLWAFLLCCLLCGSAPAQSASPAAWKSRTIYQLLTDRFAQTSDGSYAPCNNLSNYCGGSFQGIINHLDYIIGMGFDAIWISPIVTNTPGGYHGYWSQDLFGINPHFGTADDLRQLISACHARGVWVMLDVVANHMGGNVPMSQLSPFNQSEHYHRCVACPSNCQINDYTPEVQLCKLAGLPDLNQTNPYVKSQLINWIRTLMDYGFDGLRIDTVPEIEPGFWVDFVSAANTYAVGEVFSDLSCCATYQKQALPGVLSYPLFWTLRSVFQQKQSMNQLQSTFFSYQSQFADMDLLGTFIDNHDNARFLSGTSDYKLYQNAITYTLMAQGIPIIYYGTEQGYDGTNDPNNRESLWQTRFSTQNPLYQLIRTIVSYRKQAQVWQYPQVQRYSDDTFYAFTRGTTFVALTNAGSNSGTLMRTITYHPYKEGTKLCEIFYPTDCVVVQNGSFPVYLDNGESKIFYPVN
ncbi:acidstable alpha-amylase [Acanthamoeba castellanii str. Neff]|uniref:alpha-amylase n=1 Tax=Acanthamoeba castellanii (strain ATCC 30010 / Neff) TaxID=1257118 RepID=L8HIM5_ACACF|nr:acidstable alpha-amylase [Acanthamoeba castellanii str. Neff]ELR25454.1 acidstable alpha-amylase [Acanthamoeba castellanii str. Neff]